MSKIYKGLILDNEVSLTVLETTSIINQAIEFHNLGQSSAEALGRALTAGVFISSTLKNKRDKFSVEFKGNGAGGNIVVCGDSSLNVRGTIQNKDLTSVEINNVVGHQGSVVIIKNMGLKKPYIGTCEIVNGDIESELISYYALSEQQPSLFVLRNEIVNNKCIFAGGVVIQLLPGYKIENIVKVSKIADKYSNFIELFKNIAVEDYLKNEFKGTNFVVSDANYKCNCSLGYIDKMLISLGKEELNLAIKEDGKIEVCCEFCNKKYLYYESDVERLLK